MTTSFVISISAVSVFLLFEIWLNHKVLKQARSLLDHSRQVNDFNAEILKANADLIGIIKGDLIEPSGMLVRSQNRI